MLKSLLFLSTLLPLLRADTTPLADGEIVPFTSGLPVCASLCGQLSNVQGACVPPVTSSVSSSCFCSDSRLTPFLQGPSSVATVCATGGTACTSTSDLQAIETWYETYCNVKAATASTTSSAGSTATSSSSSSGSTSSKSTAGTSWISTHYKWVVMLIILALAIPGLWTLAFFLRRRYIRKRDREFEMRPPVALGPHQMQGMTGGYTYGDGVGSRAGVDGGHQKEARTVQQPLSSPASANAPQGKRESKGWLRKARK